MRERQALLEERYQVPVSPDRISTVTQEVLTEVSAWQSRPLEPVYVEVAVDALRVKSRDDGVGRNKAVYLALGVHRDVTKDMLGFWIARTEGGLHRVAGHLPGAQ